MSTVMKVHPVSRKDIEAITHKYLQDNFPEHTLAPGALRVDKLIDITLFKTHGFSPKIVKKLPPKIEARTIFHEFKIEIPEETSEKLYAGDGRARYTGCHEAIHVIMHSAQVLSLSTNELYEKVMSVARAESQVKRYEDADWQAEYGGAALLMPICTFIPFANNLVDKMISLYDLVGEIMKTYKVSNLAARNRLKKLNIIR